MTSSDEPTLHVEYLGLTDPPPSSPPTDSIKLLLSATTHGAVVVVSGNHRTRTLSTPHTRGTQAHVSESPEQNMNLRHRSFPKPTKPHLNLVPLWNSSLLLSSPRNHQPSPPHHPTPRDPVGDPSVKQAEALAIRTTSTTIPQRQVRQSSPLSPNAIYRPSPSKRVRAVRISD
jgi:hypothetical protein